MSRKTLPKENFFLLKEKKQSCNLRIMDTPKQIYTRFYKALKEKKSEYGSGFNKFLHLETGISTGFLSLVMSGKKKASQNAQIKISDACGFDYKSFFTDTRQEPIEEEENLKEKYNLMKKLLKMQEQRISDLENQLESQRSEAKSALPNSKKA